MSVGQFYNDISEYYDLIFEDWDQSMARQGTAIADILECQIVAKHGGSRLRVLDVSCGIGTQSLALTSLGFDVTARDLSGAAICRLEIEATKRGLLVDAATCAEYPNQLSAHMRL